MQVMCTVYDSKALAYGTPFFSQNMVTALRDFQRAAADPNSNLFHFPEDYTLYELGSFNSHLGTVSLEQAAINHGNANQFKRS